MTFQRSLPTFTWFHQNLPTGFIRTPHCSIIHAYTSFTQYFLTITIELSISLNISFEKVIAISWILFSIVYFPFLSVIEWFSEALLGYSRVPAAVLYKAIPNLMFSQLSDIEISISKWRMQFYSNVIFRWRITSSPYVILAGSEKVFTSLFCSSVFLAKYTTWWGVKSLSSLIFSTLTLLWMWIQNVIALGWPGWQWFTDC